MTLDTNANKVNAESKIKDGVPIRVGFENANDAAPKNA